MSQPYSIRSWVEKHLIEPTKLKIHKFLELQIQNFSTHLHGKLSLCQHCCPNPEKIKKKKKKFLFSLAIMDCNASF